MKKPEAVQLFFKKKVMIRKRYLGNLNNIKTLLWMHQCSLNFILNL